MSTSIQIYQGNQIGGCVTVITYADVEKTTRLMIDYGQSLPGAEKKEDFQYDWGSEPVDAVLFTHYHGDHTGRFLEIPAETKLYMGAASRKIMMNCARSMRGRRMQRREDIGQEISLIIPGNCAARSAMVPVRSVLTYSFCRMWKLPVRIAAVHGMRRRQVWSGGYRRKVTVPIRFWR